MQMAWISELHADRRTAARLDAARPIRRAGVKLDVQNTLDAFEYLQ